MNVQQYINQFQNKITNIQRQMANELSKSSSVASRSAKKDIYVLYVDGQKLGYFADNFSCKAQATSMKRKMEGLMDDAMKSIPNKYAGNIKSQYKSLINNIRCDCRKEQNPNYQYSKSTANKGTNTKNSNPSTNPLTPPPIKSPLITGKSVEVPKSQNEIKQENKTLSDLIIGNKSNISTNTTDLLVTPETNLNFDNKTQYENPLNRLLQKSKARTNEENMITKMNAKINNEVSIKSDYTNEQTKEEIAREEWLNKLDKMSEDELKNRESIYKTYLD
ncbi:MAG: hypothetical protein LBR28_06350, partial [Bacteroidales bacterium]|nr:hypothetical protein [Bacteroidales bacterium]